MKRGEGEDVALHDGFFAAGAEGSFGIGHIVDISEINVPEPGRTGDFARAGESFERGGG